MLFYKTEACDPWTPRYIITLKTMNYHYDHNLSNLIWQENVSNEN